MSTATVSSLKSGFLRVPEVTLVFWLIKTLSTTVGETGADYLSFGLGWGMPLTTLLMLGLMACGLYLQFFKFKRYVVANYWGLVVLMSIVGTLVTDMLVDLAGVGLVPLSIAFSVLMLAGFALWYRKEGTLSIHSIDTGKREFFYWIVILFAFALGTGVGDLISESLALGYDVALLLFAGMIGLVILAYYTLKLNAVVAFWIAYVLTRPLGASLGDYLIQAPSEHGLGISMGTVNLVFAIAIILLATFEWCRTRHVSIEVVDVN